MSSLSSPESEADSSVSKTDQSTNALRLAAKTAEMRLFFALFLLGGAMIATDQTSPGQLEILRYLLLAASGVFGMRSSVKVSALLKPVTKAVEP